MKLFLIRHGQTTANLQQTYAGQTDVPLTQTGRQQAESIRPILAKFHFDRVYSSDLSRAIDTQRLAIPGVEGIRTPLLREIDVGSIAGIPFQQLKEQLNGQRIADLPGRFAYFGGESNEMFLDRARRFLKILEEDPCENVAAFAHGGMLGAALQVVLDADFDRSHVSSPNCTIHVYEYANGLWRLLAWNYMGEI